MLSHSLLSFGFIIMVVYGVAAVPLYVVTIAIILKTKTLSTSFYTIYVAMAVANLMMYFNKYPAVRLPLFTCGDCVMASVFNGTRYRWLTGSVFVHWHISYTQFCLPSLIAFDRFVVIVLGADVGRYWKKIYPLVIVILYVAPIFFTLEVLKSNVNYEYKAAADNFGYTISGNLLALYDSITVLMLSTCLISLIFNSTVFFQFFLGNMKIPGAQRAVELKLFLNCLVDMCTQLASAGVTYAQKVTKVTDPEEYDNFRAIVLYVVDIMSLLPPFILLLTSEQVRERILVPNWFPLELDVSFAVPPDISPQCMNSTRRWKADWKSFFDALIVCSVTGYKNCPDRVKSSLKNNLYAVKQFDSFGKLPSGMLDVTMVNAGSYPECVQVGKMQNYYETQYCYMETKLGKHGSCDKPINFPFRAAVCMPNSCSEKDLTLLFNNYGKLGLTTCSAQCVPQKVEIDWFFVFYTTVLGLIIVIVLIASLIDYILDDIYKWNMKDIKNTGLKCLLAFSLYTNAPTILSTTPAREGHLKSLDCIRFMSIMWVCAGHTMSNFTSNDDLWYLTYLGDPVMADTFLSAFYAVDTFFLLSGIVVSYLFFKKMPKLAMIKSPVTWIFYYVHRFIRLTTPYILFVGFFIAFGPFIQSPQTISTGNNLTGQISQCRKFWWINILYIINFFKPGHACYGISWYLAADMQLYFVAPIFLVLLWFSHVLGLIGLFLAGTGSVIATFVLTYHYDLPASPITLNGKLGSEFMNKLYIQPWIRCTPYLIGIWVGYFLAVYGKRKFRINSIIIIVTWLFFIATALACVYAPHDYLSLHQTWSKFVRSFFYSFSRIGWSLSVSWVIIANYKSWGGPIAKFMEHPLWQPLGRISYCFYISHWMIIYYYYSISDRPLHMNSIWQAYLYYTLPITLIATIFSVFWSCLCEIPFIRLEKMGTDALLNMFQPQTTTQVDQNVKEEYWDVEKENVEKL